MPGFVHSPLLWGLLIVGVPVLIHLINMLRHRRVQWAAMEFLLQSQKKNSTWIRLKELLLLLLRMLAVAAVVLMLAQPLLRDQWGRLFGGSRTHHIVLVDDSFSMSDRWADTSAFEQAKEVIKRIGEYAARQPELQSFTLVPFSASIDQSDTRRHIQLREAMVDSHFADFAKDNRVSGPLDKALTPLVPTQLSVAPQQAVKFIVSLLGESKEEERILYLVSDFRARDWESPGELTKNLKELTGQRTKLELINCVTAARPNLAITALQPQPGTRAAGVPLMMEVTVKNFGANRVKQVSVLLSEEGQARPALTIDEIAPGASEKRHFPVFFATAGEHLVTASLQGDALSDDNVRYSLIDLPVAIPVLIVDADPDARDGHFLATALAPGGTVKTGVAPQIELPAYLSNHPLDKFHTIYLTNVDRFDASAVKALETYVKNGGGVGFFLGEKTLVKFYNEQLYRDGQGVLPVPLIGETQLLVDRLEKGPDVEVENHPVFRIFAGERNSFLNAVVVERYIAADPKWKPSSDSPARVIARLRNGSPLVVEQPLGKGRVVAVLTTAAPTERVLGDRRELKPAWNNWGRNPSYVVAILEMQSYLSAASAAEAARLVGSPLTVPLADEKYQPEARLSPPNLGGALVPPDELKPGPAGHTAKFSQTESAGVYEVRLTRKDQQTESRRFTVNVEPEEGNLAIIARDDLAEKLKDVPHEYRLAADFQMQARELAGSNLSSWILYLLILTLLGEQMLAYFCSYHPPAKEAPR